MVKGMQIPTSLLFWIIVVLLTAAGIFIVLAVVGPGTTETGSNIFSQVYDAIFGHFG